MRRPYDYFKFSEFDSPDAPGSGEEHMDREFLRLLDQARAIAGVAFRITSGYRTTEYHQDLTDRGYPTSPDSAHLHGCAADIEVKNSRQRYLIIRALLTVGLNRIGIGRTFVHVDNLETKTEDLIWTYEN